MNSNAIRLGIVIPLANEEATIIPLLERLAPQLGAQDRVFCVLDQMCNDRTRALIQEYHDQKDPRFQVVWAPENRSVVDAYFRGYREAYAQGATWILEMDGGLSHLPEQIPQFIQGMEEHFDYVGGSRFMPGGAHRGPLNRRLISWDGTVLARVLLRAPMTDMTSGFECFTRSAMREILEKGVRSRANFFQTEIRYLMCRRRWKEVPILYSNDRVSVGRSSIRETFRILFTLFWERLKTP